MATQETKSSVGVRELHNHTSELIKVVAESGFDMEITIHGRPVARIVAIKDDDPVEDLRRRGMIREGKSSGRKLAPPIRLKDGATISDLVIEQRR
jgi:prevent-host-death family protein